jgi:LmbE family N-acetylglucosaminyl deacetylase
MTASRPRPAASAAAASRPRLSETPILIVEPHFDDAAFSCAAVLDRAEPVDVVTVFASEPEPPRRGYWDAVCGFADSREAIASRRAEHAAAFGGSPHRLSSLPLVERQYLDADRPHSDARAIRDAVAEWAGRHPGGIVALPAGAGWSANALVRRVACALGRERVRPHREHLYVRDSALLGLSDAWTPLLYEELPYLFGGAGDGEAARAARSVIRRCTPVIEPVDRAKKAARIAHYSSQVPFISPANRRLDDPAALPPVERYWLLEQ